MKREWIEEIIINEWQETFNDETQQGSKHFNKNLTKIQSFCNYEKKQIWNDEYLVLADSNDIMMNKKGEELLPTWA